MHSQKPKKRQRGTFWRHVFSASLAGTLSKTFTAPLERVKLILQTKAMLKAESQYPMTNFRNTFYGMLCGSTVISYL